MTATYNSLRPSLSKGFDTNSSLSLLPRIRSRISTDPIRNIHGSLFFSITGTDESAFKSVSNKIFLIMLSNLAPKDIARFGLVSKKWYRISRNEDLWKGIYNQKLIFPPAQSTTWYRDCIHALQHKKPSVKLDEPRDVEGCFGHEIMKAGNHVFMFKRNENKKYISVIQTNIIDGTRINMSYRDFVKLMTRDMVPEEDIIDEGVHLFDQSTNLLYWVSTLADDPPAGSSKRKKYLAVHVINMKGGGPIKTFRPCPILIVDEKSKKKVRSYC